MLNDIVVQTRTDMCSVATIVLYYESQDDYESVGSLAELARTVLTTFARLLVSEGCRQVESTEEAYQILRTRKLVGMHEKRKGRHNTFLNMRSQSIDKEGGFLEAGSTKDRRMHLSEAEIEQVKSAYDNDPALQQFIKNEGAKIRTNIEQAEKLEKAKLQYSRKSSEAELKELEDMSSELDSMIESKKHEEKDNC